MKQTLYGMNGLDSPTAGNNINTRPGTKQWHGYLYKQTGSHDMNNQWEHDTMNKGTNSKETWGQGKQDTNENHD